MSSSYVIQWKSTVNGRAGRGTKQFDRREAEQLAEELNREYPDIQHEAVEALPEQEMDVVVAVGVEMESEQAVDEPPERVVVE